MTEAALFIFCQYWRCSMSRRKKRFKIRYVVLGILLVLVIAVAAVIGTHWDLIKAAKMGLTTDSETILAEQQKKDKEIQESLGIDGLITDEMIAQAQAEIEQSWAEENGEVSAEPGQTSEAGQQTENAGQAGQQSQASGQTQQTGATGNAGTGSGSGGNSAAGSGGGQQTGTDIVAKYTAKLYGIRGAYQGRVNGIIASAKSEYAALPAEQQTSSAQSSILASKMGQAEALEAECDAKVNALLGEMSAELSAAGESTDSVNQLRNYYEDAKASQKAAYLAQARGN